MSNLIEYFGVSEYIPKDILCHREFNIESILKIGQNKPKIQEIIKVSVSPVIKSHRIIKTPIGKSLEGQVLTGKKYIIEGENRIRIDYLSEDGSNKIYYTYHNEKFSSSIVVHESLINSNTIIPSIFIEGINGELLNREQVIIIITTLFTIEK